MKVYISADMEGITGIANRKFLMDNEPEYQRGRKLLTGDVNAAIEGALAAGATEILVNDAHGNMRNILIEELNENASLVTGFPKKDLMCAGIDERFNCALFIGYHSMANTQGMMAHTISGGLFAAVRLNGKPCGETAISAAIAGHYGVPVLAVSGDDILAAEVKQLLPEALFAQTKTSLSNTAGILLHPAKTRPLIRETVEKALKAKAKPAPYRFAKEVTVEVDLRNTQQADLIDKIPGAERKGDITVSFKAADMLQANEFITTAMSVNALLGTGVY